MAKIPFYSLFNTCYIFLLFSLLFITPISSSDTPSSICQYTLFPSICKSLFPSINPFFNSHDFARFSISKSLSASQNSLSLIKNSHDHDFKNSNITVRRALEDCVFLAESNVDYLGRIFISVAKIFLGGSEVDDVQTLLSAILTNSETCITGLQAADPFMNGMNGILSKIEQDTKLFSVSLGLFCKIWVLEKPWNPFAYSPSRWNQLKRRNGNLNLRMSDQNREIYETVNNRTQISDEDGDNQVLVSDVVIVSKDGSGDFTAINDAVAAAPTNSDGGNGYFLIYITAGVYEEYVSIGSNKKYLMMIGDGINQTIITGNHNVADGWTTFNSPTFIVVGEGFVGVNITVRNTAGPTKGQAVALRNGADLSTFYSCSFEAYQDTLYVHSLRQFYRECDVYGTVDFIFGNAATVLQDCNIYPRLPMRGQFIAITAQGRSDPNQNTGISIHNCVIRASDELANGNFTVRTYLGRPWREYSRTVVMTSFIDSLVDPAGWSIWSGDFALNTSYYAEYKNSGPGSNVSGRVTWPGFHVINAFEAVNFTVYGFLMGDDWIPKTGVPFERGLF